MTDLWAIVPIILLVDITKISLVAVKNCDDQMVACNTDPILVEEALGMVYLQLQKKCSPHLAECSLALVKEHQLDGTPYHMVSLDKPIQKECSPPHLAECSLALIKEHQLV